MDLKETYNHIAEDWHNDHKKDTWWVECTDKFISLMKPGSQVLDIGCGAGLKADYLMNHDLRVLGIDFSQEMIKVAQREFPQIEFRVLDLIDVKDLNDFFEGIFMQAVLLHVPKKDASQRISEIARKLNPNGYFYIAVKAQTDQEEEIVKEDDYGYQYERFFSYYTKEEIRGYFEEAGLTVIYENTPDSGKRGWIQMIGQKK